MLLDLVANICSGFWYVSASLVAQRASLVVQTVKNLPAMQKTQVQSLGQGKSPGEGNGNPLQHSCLGNPMGQRSLAGYHPCGCKELDTI